MNRLPKKRGITQIGEDKSLILRSWIRELIYKRTYTPA
jgi:hypothetical protein